MAKQKVPSVEEFMDLHRKQVAENVKEFSKGIQKKINAIPKQRHPDYSEIVKEKVEKDGVSYSSLKSFRKSPLSYIEHITTKFVQTPAMFEGSIIDVLVTEPKEFTKKYYIIPEKVSRASNEGKAKMFLYEEMADGKIIIDIALYEKCVAICEALYKNDDCRYYLDKVKYSQKWIKYRHAESGLKVRGVLDGESEEEPKDYPFFIMDLKSAKDADEDKFKRDAANLWYNGQVGVYTLYYRKRFQFPDFIHVVIEKSPPYNCNTFRSSQDYIREAQEEVHNTLMAFKYCMDNNLWHKSFDFIRDEQLHYAEMKLPNYYKSKF